MERERETDKRKLGRRLIGGAPLAFLLAVVAFLASLGPGLDEDPSTNAPLAVVYTTYAALVGAAAMLLGGITLLWAARKERMASPDTEREHKSSKGWGLIRWAPLAVAFGFLAGLGNGYVALASLVGAAAMVLGGIVLVWKARKERKISPGRTPRHSD